MPMYWRRNASPPAEETPRHRRLPDARYFLRTYLHTPDARAEDNLERTAQTGPPTPRSPARGVRARDEARATSASLKNATWSNRWRRSCLHTRARCRPLIILEVVVAR